MPQINGFGVMDFYKTIQSRGLARSNLFRIKSIGNDSNRIFDNDDTDLYLLAQGGALPSRQISTSKISFRSFDFVVPMAASYPESSNWSLTFYCDSQYVLRDIFEKWSRTTFDEHKQISTSGLVDVEIALLDNSIPEGGDVPLMLGKNQRSHRKYQMKEVRTYKLVGSFPTMIGPMNYTVANAGELASMSITLAFQYLISTNAS